MTKAEWWTGDAPAGMIRFGRAAGSDRKLRLLAVALFRLARHGSCPEDAWERVLERGERYAERNANVAGSSPTAPTDPTAMAALRMLATENPVTAASSASVWTIERTGMLVGRVLNRRPEEAAAQAALVRDIFGNPFRAPVFQPEWRTGTTVAIAQQMYASRDFSAIPILADALQDAGCDNDDLVRHCREPGGHVRGCWAVDLVLGNV